MNGKKSNIVLSTRVPRLTHEQVEQAAASRGITVSEMMRWLIEAWAAEDEQDAKLMEAARRRRLRELLEEAIGLIGNGWFTSALPLIEKTVSVLKAIEAGEDVDDVLFPPEAPKRPPDLVRVPYPGQPGVFIKVERSDAIAAGLWPLDGGSEKQSE